MKWLINNSCVVCGDSLFEQGIDILNFEDLAAFGLTDFSGITITDDGVNTLISANDSDFQIELSGVFVLTDSDFSWG